ncbi:MAG: hypothetical protein U1E77_18640 [Inhella sp.]
MNWRIPGGLLLLVGFSLLLGSLRDSFDAVQFRWNATEVQGRIIVSNIHYEWIEFPTAHGGVGHLLKPGGRHMRLGQTLPVLLPNATTPPFSKPILKSDWRLLKFEHLVALGLLVWGRTYWQRGRDA